LATNVHEIFSKEIKQFPLNLSWKKNLFNRDD
jgi:hypothetical protein